MLRLFYNAVLQRWPFAIWSIYGIYSKQNHWKELKACWISSLKAVKPSFVFWDCSSESQIIASLLASPSQTSSWWINIEKKRPLGKKQLSATETFCNSFHLKTFQNSKPSTIAGPFFADANLLVLGVLVFFWSSTTPTSSRLVLTVGASRGIHESNVGRRCQKI